MTDEIQLQLFEAGHELLTLEDDAARGVYSGVIVEKQRERVAHIVRALAEGFGLARIAKAFGVSVHTVLGIRARHPELIALERKQLSGQIGRILKLSADRYEEALIAGEVNAAQLPVPFGIFADKKAALDGDAGLIVRVEHEQVPSVDELTRRLEQMRRLPVEVPGVEASAECNSCKTDENAQ